MTTSIASHARSGSIARCCEFLRARGDEIALTSDDDHVVAAARRLSIPLPAAALPRSVECAWRSRGRDTVLAAACAESGDRGCPAGARRETAASGPLWRNTTQYSVESLIRTFWYLLMAIGVNTRDGIQTLRSIDRDRLAGARPDAHDWLSRRGQDRVHQEPRSRLRARGHQVQGHRPRRLDSGTTGLRRLSGV